MSFTQPAKKEAKRLEKLAKLAAKTAKAPALGNGAAKEKKVKEVKPKEEEEVYVNVTPKGEKKGECGTFQIVREGGGRDTDVDL